MSLPTPLAVSTIVPTIGRPESLVRLLDSLTRQTHRVLEVIVADGSDDGRTAAVIADPRWRAAGLPITRVPVQPPHAVRQRMAAIAVARGECLLLLDDDVALEPDCLEQMVNAMTGSAGIAGVMADFNNEAWPEPPTAWRFYMRHVLGMAEGSWQGRVIGPLLRFGFTPRPTGERPLEWFSTCNTLVRRSAYDAAGGFSDFFLHRSTINEDVDLALKVAGQGRLVFCPAARLGHFQDAGGRVTVAAAAEDDLYNRFLIMRYTQALGSARAFGQVVLYFVVETASNIVGGSTRLAWPGLWPRTIGRLRAIGRVLTVS